MTKYSNQYPTGLNNGAAKLITAITLGTAETIQTSTVTVDDYDSTLLYAANNDSSANVTLNLVLPDVDNPGSFVEFPIILEQGKGFYPIMPPIRMGGANDLIIKAYASVASKVVIIGVNDRLE